MNALCREAIHMVVDTLRTLVHIAIHNEPWRHYHTMKHIDRVVEALLSLDFDSWNLTVADAKVLALTAMYHDIVYDPTRADNEVMSAHYLHEQRSWVKRTTNDHVTDQDIDRALGMIRDTSRVQTPEELRTSPLTQIFQDADCDIIRRGSLADLIEYENGILKEFQCAPHTTYVEKRLEVLDHLIKCYPLSEARLEALKEYVRSRRLKVALYVGSFNPFHIGHLNVVERASEIFDKVIIYQGSNPAKGAPSYNIMSARRLRFYERWVSSAAFIKDIVDRYSADYDVTLIRGLRNGLDMSYEFDYKQWLHDFGVRCQVVYIPADNALAHISSSSLRGLSSIAPEEAAKFIVN